MQLGNDVGHLSDGPGEAPGILNEAAQVAHLDLPLEEQHSAEGADEGHGNVVDQVHRGTGDGTVGLCLGVGGHCLLIFHIKLAQHRLLLAVGTDGLLSLEHLLHEAVELAQLS